DAARASAAYERELDDLRSALSRRGEQAQRLYALIRRREQRLVDEAAHRRSEQAHRLYALIRRREERLSNGVATVDDPTLGHVLYVQLAGRYELIERDGTAPEPGSVLELAEGEHAVVGWIGKSPLPGDRRRCAFAQQHVLALRN